VKESVCGEPPLTSDLRLLKIYLSAIFKTMPILISAGFPGDIFGDLFGGLFGMSGFSGGRRHSRRKGEDTFHPLRVSLEDLYNGKTSKLQLRKTVICKKCKGYVYKQMLIIHIS
jgi:DnaJ family protein A protein 2